MRFIIIMIIAYLAYKFLKGLFLNKGAQQRRVPGQHGQSGQMASGEDLVEDPYCHTYIPLSNALRISVQGKNVYFCSKKCLEKFKSMERNSS